MKKKTYFPIEDYHTLCDSGYGLKDWLLTPFKDFGNLSRKQRHYNKIHSKSRVVVENTFGLLKGRFRKLRQLNVRIEHAAVLVNACCVLHNFCFLHGDTVEIEIYCEPVRRNQVEHQFDGGQQAAGIIKRNRIADALYGCR